MTGEVDTRGAACWSPDGQWIVTGGKDAKGVGLFKIPIDGGAPVRLLVGSALNPVWSPAGTPIVYIGAVVANKSPLLAVRPDGAPIELPSIGVYYSGERFRFLPSGKGLVYMQGSQPWQDFWLLDLATKKTHQLTHLDDGAAMRTFDITPDGKQIVFDRLRENSDIVTGWLRACRRASCRRAARFNSADCHHSGIVKLRQISTIFRQARPNARTEINKSAVVLALKPPTNSPS